MNHMEYQVTNTDQLYELRVPYALFYCFITTGKLLTWWHNSGNGCKHAQRNQKQIFFVFATYTHKEHVWDCERMHIDLKIRYKLEICVYVSKFCSTYFVHRWRGPCPSTTCSHGLCQWYLLALSMALQVWHTNLGARYVLMKTISK